MDWTLGKGGSSLLSLCGHSGCQSGEQNSHVPACPSPKGPTLPWLSHLLSPEAPSRSPCPPVGEARLLLLPLFCLRTLPHSPVAMCLSAGGSWLPSGCEHTLPSAGPQAQVNELGCVGWGWAWLAPSGPWLPLFPLEPSPHSVALCGWAHVPCPLYPHWARGPWPSSALWVPWQLSPWGHSGCPGTLRTCQDPEAEAH